jgi:DNA-binding response OmpR family regulator
MTDPAIHTVFFTPDLEFSQIIARALGDGFDIRPSEGLGPAGSRELQGSCDVVLLDLRQPGTDTVRARFAMMDAIRQEESAPPIIVLLDDDDRTWTCRVFEKGAYDAVTCPPNIAELRFVLRRAWRLRQVEKELERLRSEEKQADTADDFVVYAEDSAVRRKRARHRGDGNGERAGGAGDPPAERARRRAVRGVFLREPSGNADRRRAVRA